MALDSTAQIYSPLSPFSIRILTLEPLIKGSKIQCTLAEIPLHSEQRPPYEALSYMWGPLEPTNTITLNGHPHIVRENLFAALKAIRHKIRPRTLWIDALCINQSDIEERSSQVLIMSSVYKEARLVLAWLGESGYKAAKLFALLKDTKGNWRKVFPTLLEVAMSHPADDALHKHPISAKRILHMSFYQFRLALQDLCCNAYWRRVWIIQEILSASSAMILCGSLRLPMEYLVAAFPRKWANLYEDEPEWPGRLIAMEYSQYQRGSGAGEATLAHLLKLCEECKSECQDSRDKIYGLLGLANDAGNLVPDYSRSALHLCFELMNSGLVTNTMRDLFQLQRLLKPYSNASLAEEYVIPEDGELPGMMLFDQMRGECSPTPALVHIHPSKLVIDSDRICPLLNCDITWKGSRNASLMDILLHSNSTQERICNCSEGTPEPDYWGKLTGLYMSDYQYIHRKGAALAFDPLSNWDKDRCVIEDCLVDMHVRPIEPSDEGQLWHGKFLTQDGAVGIVVIRKHGALWPGDILCHVDGSDGGFVLVRGLQNGKFKYLGLAMLLERKHKDTGVVADTTRSGEHPDIVV